MKKEIDTYYAFYKKLSKLTEEQFNEVIHLIRLELNQQSDSPYEKCFHQAE